MATQEELEAMFPWMESPELYMDPEEQWRTYTASAAPFWQKRAPLYDVGQGLQARHMMAAPRMLEEDTGALGTFGEYLRGWGGGYGYAPQTELQPYGAGSLADLRSRALEVGRAASPGKGGVGTYLQQGFGEGADEFRRRSWYLRQFGADAANQQANIMKIANLMATQRPGGGEYGGGMAAAIRSAMSQLQDQYVRRGNPREGFLNWYLGATDPGLTVEDRRTAAMMPDVV